MAKLNLFAAIDIGSSQIGMKIFQLKKNDSISVVESCQSNLSIGKETYNVGKISYELTSEICSCLENFKRIMNEYGVSDYICYATSAVREASNSEYIRDQILIRTGLKVGIASNEEERFLHYKALALNMKDFDDIIEEGALIVEVSSGSMQVSCYEKAKLQFSQNLPLGSLRITEIMSGVKNSTVVFSKLLKEYTANMLDIYKKSFFASVKYKNIILMGSHTDNIKAALKAENDIVTSKQLEELYNRINEEGLYDFSDKHNFSYEESRLMMASLLLFRQFTDNFEKKIYMPDIEFTDGICVEYAEKNKFTHTRHIFTNDIFSSAMYYAERYGIDKKHTEKIMLYCEEIFSALSKKFGLSKFDLVLLKVAAIFSSTGYYINVNDYNIYSYNITKANKLLGLSNKDNEIISLVVLFQNGVFDTEEYRYISKSRKLLIAKLAAILSLAVSIDYEHRQKVEKIKVTLKDGEMVINAYTDSDITLEKWQFNDREEFFEDVFGIPARLKNRNL